MEKLSKIAKFFSLIGHKYVKNNLAIIDLLRLRIDPIFGLKLFFFYWAYERQGAASGYKIAAIKAVSSGYPSNIPDEFKKFYKGNKNENRNPALDPKISKLDVPCIISLIEDLKFSLAFEKLNLNGLAHKIRAFFLRDITYLLQVDENKVTFKDYIYMVPIDVWVRNTISALQLENILDISKENQYRWSDFGFSQKYDYLTALRLIKFAQVSKVSPLLINMGIWYFCSRCVADSQRLAEILKDKDVKILQHEISLLSPFDEISMTF